MNENYARDITFEHDRKNLAAIDNALKSGRINIEAAEYLRTLYYDSMDWFRQVFYVLGKCFGAPKTAVEKYNAQSTQGHNAPMKIADIHPLEPYLVQHRLDADPMRNQFFTTTGCHQVDLSVSSIVTVIVGAQKNIERAIDKITDKYYNDYTNEVCDVVYRIISAKISDSAALILVSQIRARFQSEYITDAAATVLGMLGDGNEHIAADLVRALDCIVKPHLRLRDVWRAKCLFDLVPQARAFIERMHEIMPGRIILARDKFFDIDNPRGYRDAKLVVNIGTDEKVVPMEIICQVRTFFEFERQTHADYENTRGYAPKWKDIESQMADFMEDGVKQYNLLIYNCLTDLFERVGWNILYSRDGDKPMFDGFPAECKLYYPQKMLDYITDKLDTAVRNEIFHMINSPAKLTRDQEIAIFRYMSRFILIAAMPYAKTDWEIPTNTMAGKLFNFVMREVQRYYKK